MKKSIYLLFTSLLVLFAYQANVYAAKLKTVEKVVIDAPVDKVWKAVGMFSDMSWHPAVKQTVMLNGSNEPGSVRTLVLDGGPIIVERLVRYEPEKWLYSYRITDMGTVKTIDYNGQKIDVKTLPVTKYYSILSVKAKGDNQSEVTWEGRYRRAYADKDGPESLNDMAANNTVKAVYRGGLDNLKKVVEAMN